MKFLQKLSGAALLSAALLFTACQKDKDPANAITPITKTNQKTCKLIKAISNDMSFEAYTYDNNGKVIKIKLFDGNYNKYSHFLTYTYNSAGKAAEEIKFTADSIAIRKRVFIYNANNLLTRIDYYSGQNQPLGYTAFQHNAAGQRILKREYWGTPDTLFRYTQYTYQQNLVKEKEYNALTTPAALLDSAEIYYDNKRSVNSALGYLDEYYPELEKHNVIARRWGFSANNNTWQNSLTSYQYDSLNYPTEAHNHGNATQGINIVTYEYNCQ